MLADGEQITLSDSRVKLDASSESPAIRYVGGGAGLVVQRSILQSAPGANPGALVVIDGNATLDSSEVLGGKDGIHFEQASGERDALTLAASTVDAGAAGIAADAAGTNGIDAIAKGGPGNSANVSVEGSIVLERQATSVAPGDEANVGCTYSAVPSQLQVAGGGAGAIACSAGNTEVNPLSTLLAEPFGNYQLNPSSSAVDSVPAAAIALPFGLTPSPTDFAGNPRVVDGNGDCIAVQDKGALEPPGSRGRMPHAAGGENHNAANKTDRRRIERAHDQPELVLGGTEGRDGLACEEEEIRREDQLPRQPGGDDDVHGAAAKCRP